MVVDDSRSCLDRVARVECGGFGRENDNQHGTVILGCFGGFRVVFAGAGCQMRKGIVFLYQRLLLPLFDRMVGKEYERLLALENPVSFSVDALGEPSLGAYVGNNVVKINSRTDHFGVLLGV